MNNPHGKKTVVFFTITTALLAQPMAPAATYTDAFFPADKMHRIFVRAYLNEKPINGVIFFKQELWGYRFKIKPDGREYLKRLHTTSCTLFKDGYTAYIPPSCKTEIIVLRGAVATTHEKLYEARAVIDNNPPEKLDLHLKPVPTDTYRISVVDARGMPQPGITITVSAAAPWEPPRRTGQSVDVKADKNGDIAVDLARNWAYELYYKIPGSVKKGPPGMAIMEFIPSRLKDKTCIFKLVPKERKPPTYTLRFMYRRNNRDVLLEEFPGCNIFRNETGGDREGTGGGVFFPACEGKLALMLGNAERVDRFKTGEKIKLKMNRRHARTLTFKKNVLRIGAAGESRKVYLVPRKDTTGRMNFSVLDEAGNPVDDAAVRVSPVGDDSWRRLPMTSPEALKEETRFVAGEYRVCVCRHGYRVFKKRFTVRKGRELTTTCRLEKAPRIEVTAVDHTGTPAGVCQITVHYRRGRFIPSRNTTDRTNGDGVGDILYDDNIDAVLSAVALPYTTAVIPLEKGRRTYRVVMPKPPEPIPCVLDTAALKEFGVPTDARDRIMWYHVDTGVYHDPATRLSDGKGTALLPPGAYYPCFDRITGCTTRPARLKRPLLRCAKVVIGKRPPEEINIIPDQAVAADEMGTYHR